MGSRLSVARLFVYVAACVMLSAACAHATTIVVPVRVDGFCPADTAFDMAPVFDTEDGQLTLHMTGVSSFSRDNVNAWQGQDSSGDFTQIDSIVHEMLTGDWALYLGDPSQTLLEGTLFGEGTWNYSQRRYLDTPGVGGLDFDTWEGGISLTLDSPNPMGSHITLYFDQSGLGYSGSAGVAPLQMTDWREGTLSDTLSPNVPEPSSLLLLGLGVVGLARRLRKRAH